MINCQVYLRKGSGCCGGKSVAGQGRAVGPLGGLTHQDVAQVVRDQGPPCASKNQRWSLLREVPQIYKCLTGPIFSWNWPCTDITSPVHFEVGATFRMSLYKAGTNSTKVQVQVICSLRSLSPWPDIGQSVHDV